MAKQRLDANLRKKQPVKHSPFPGFIDGNEWQIREGKHPAFVAKTPDGYVMQVPMGDSDSDRRVRLHEQGHVAFTPFLSEEEMPKGVEFDTLNAVEDARVAIKLANTSAEYGRLNREVPILDRQMRYDFANQFQEQNNAVNSFGKSEYKGVAPNLLEMARFIAASKGYEEEQLFHDLARQNDFNFLNEIVDELYDQHFAGKVPEFDDTVRFAKELEERVGKKQDELLTQMAEQNALLEEAGLEGMNPNRNGRRFPNHPGKWGEMKIVDNLPLTERMPNGIKTHINRATDQGFIPVNWHRLATDKRVFNRRKTRESDCGTILVDQSGSMSLSIEEMQAIIARWPGVVIAGYSGASNRKRGELRILAKNGKTVRRELLPPTCGQLNIIDGPALNWLAKQKAPRIWISDGLVTGIGENRNETHILDAARIVKRGRITRIEDVRVILGDL